MARLSQGQIYAIAVAVGMKEPRTMAAIAMGESSGDTHAHNAVPPDDSYGLWQINMHGDLGPARRRQFGLSSNKDLFNPVTNARIAKSLQASQGLGAWGAYTNGSYRQYMDDDATAPAGWDPFEDWRDPLDILPDEGDSPIPGKEWLDVAGEGAKITAGQITRLADMAAQLGDWLSNPQFWVRVLYVVGGAAVVIGGLVIVSKPLVQGAAEMTPAGAIAKGVTK